MYYCRAVTCIDAVPAPQIASYVRVKGDSGRQVLMANRLYGELLMEKKC